jgi:hypothetical protein
MRIRSILGSLFIASLIVACGGAEAAPVGDGDNTPFTSDPDKTVVVGGAAEGGNAAQTPSATGCVKLPSGECVDAKSCAAGERRDVIVDSAGKVTAVVCYPADATPPAIDAQGDVTLGKNQNNGVVAIDGANDGVDIAGDVTAAGNNVTVYGEGPDVSVIGGNVGATGNNFAMRGVTVKGNVEVSGNNAVLVLCAVEGNIRIVGNNNVIADCDVLGNIVIEGVNNTLVANHVGGTISVSETKNLVCDGNTKWNDANTNKVFDAGEAGAALECTNKK